MMAIETRVMDEAQKTPKYTKQKSEKNNKHVEEKKTKKVNPPKHRKIAYELPRGRKYNFKNGHCDCRQPSGRQANLKVKIGGETVRLSFHPCLKCLRPIRQTHATNKNCCWKTYCKECSHETEFYMQHDTGDKRILRCFKVFPFELHEIEYASTAEFNDAVGRGQIKYICSKDPNHIRGHVYDDGYRVTRGMDCKNAKYYKKSTK